MGYKTECDINCFSYEISDGVGGCVALEDWGNSHTPIESEEDCFRPYKKDLGTHLGIISSIDLNLALEKSFMEDDEKGIIKILTRKYTPRD